MRTAGLALLVLLAPLDARADQTAFMPLIINTVKQGETQVILRKKDVLVEVSALKGAGLRWQGGRIERLGDNVYISLASLAPDIAYRVDEREIVLRLTVRPALLKTTIVDLKPGAPRDIVYRQDTSGFFNYALQTQDATYLSSFNEAGFSFHGGLLYSSVAVSSLTWLPVRGLTNLTIDQPSRMRRWKIGDNFTATGALGGGLFLAGVTLARSYDVNPYFVSQPMLGSSGAALTPSTLEIYVNDRLVKRASLPPGPYQVENLSPTSGAGSTRYVLRDAFGRQTEMSSRYYFATTLLAKGLHDYSYAIGFRRNHVGTESFDYGMPAVLGRHRLGLLDWLTGELRLEGDIEGLSGGGALALQTPIGQLGLSAAASVAQGGAGVAGLLSYQYNSRAFGAGLHVTAVSKHYATLSLGALERRAMVELGSNAGVSLSRWVTLSAQYSLSLWHDQLLQDRLEARVMVNLPRGLSLTLSASRSSSRPGPESFELYAGLNFSLGHGVSGSTSWRQRDDSGEAELRLQKSLPQGPGQGYRLNVAAGEKDQRVSGLYRFQNSLGRYSAEYDFTDGKSHLRTQVAGGVVAIRGGGLFATRPVHEGFALIRIPGVEGVRGYLNNNEVGRTNSQGNLVVPDLLPYYGNRLSVEPMDIPLDRSFRALHRTVATPLRGGALVEFRAKQSHFFRGTMVVRRGGRDVTPAYGELTISSGQHQTESPLGLAGEFELEDPRPGPSTAEVVWQGGRCRMTLTIPASSQLVLELGKVRCIEKGARP